jgi:hypothetical protein
VKQEDFFFKLNSRFVLCPQDFSHVFEAISEEAIFKKVERFHQTVFDPSMLLFPLEFSIVEELYFVHYFELLEYHFRKTPSPVRWLCPLS